MKHRVAFFVLVLAALVALYIAFQLYVPVNPKKPVDEFRVAEGMSFTQAVTMLEQKGLIRGKVLLKIIGRLTGADRRMKPGFYKVAGTITPWGLFKLLRDGRRIEIEVTVIEGDCLNDIKAKLVEKRLMSAEDFDRLSRDRSFLDSMGVDGPTLEGYLFPDTYFIPKGTPPEKVLSVMVQRLMELYSGELATRTNELGMSLKSVLTLASIIEKEAQVDGERPLISAVFYNRLKKGMPLQADPTAVYGLKNFNGHVSRLDLLRDSMYNTYRFRGLPPGPIASAGLKSIRAALFPADVPYLYFVSNYNGTHTFSTEYDQHIKAVEQYRLKVDAGMKRNGQE